MTRQQKIARAERLRSQGHTYEEIAASVGVTQHTVYSWLNPDYYERSLAKARAWKARNKRAVREYGRAYDEAHKGECRQCGAEVYRENDGCICLACREDEVDRRARQIERWWAEGLLLRQIAAKLGWTKNDLSTEMARLRKKGSYDLPYRYKVRNGKRVSA